LAFLLKPSGHPLASETIIKCADDAIFSAQNVIDYINAIEAPNAQSNRESGFAVVLKGLSEEKEVLLDGKDRLLTLMIDVVALPLLFKLSLDVMNQPSSKIAADQKSLLAASLLSSLDELSLPSPLPTSDSAAGVIQLSMRHFQKLCGLLEVFVESPSPPSEILSSTLSSIAEKCLPFLNFADEAIVALVWNALALLMKIDFDVVLTIMDQLTAKLHSATPHFLRALATTNFQLRNSVEFIKLWDKLLYENGEQGPLSRADFIKLYIPSECI